MTNCSGAVPGGADTAVIPDTANDPIISANADIGTLTIQSGAIVTINTAVTLTAGSLNLSGTLTGGGDITVSLTAVWNTGGVMSGSGETHIMGSATFDLSAYSVDLIGRTVRNEGAMTWTGRPPSGPRLAQPSSTRPPGPSTPRQLPEISNGTEMVYHFKMMELSPSTGLTIMA